MERPTSNLSLYFTKVQQPAVKLHAVLTLTLHLEGCQLLASTAGMVLSTQCRK